VNNTVGYQQYFEFIAPPFSIAPNPDYLFMTQRHQDALAHLLYSVQSDGGFILLTGEIGTGKTTICRCFLEQLPKNTDVAFIVSPCLSPKELLRAICKDFQVEYKKEQPTFWELIEALSDFLLKNHGKGNNTVLIIDEAQHLNAKMLELIRLLTNLETNTKKLLQVILIGQPELNDTLAKPSLQQLSQRVTARYHIEPLNVKETTSYIWHRLKVSGNSKGGDIFPVAIIKKIHQKTLGIPRLINVLCDRALLGAYSKGAQTVSDEVLAQSIKEVEGNYSKSKKSGKSLYYIAAFLGALLLIGFVWQYFFPHILFNQYLAKEQLVKQESVAKDDILRPKSLSMDDPNTNSLKTTLDDSAPDEESSIAAIKPYTLSKQEALTALLSRVDKGVASTINDCDLLSVTSWRCEEMQAKSWSELISINRPAIVEMDINGLGKRYASIVSITNAKAQLIVLSNSLANQTGTLVDVPLTELGESWDGQLTYLWQPPLGFEKLAKVGDRGAIVQWLIKAFAFVDGREGFFEGSEFTSGLEKRVVLFQKNHNIVADGIVGVKTILKLQEALNIAVTLSPKTLSSKMLAPKSTGKEDG